MRWFRRRDAPPALKEDDTEPVEIDGDRLVFWKAKSEEVEVGGSRRGDLRARLDRRREQHRSHARRTSRVGYPWPSGGVRSEARPSARGGV